MTQDQQYFQPAIDYYNDVQELLIEDDLIETDITVTGWSKKLRIRALDFDKAMHINQKATNDKGEIVEREFILQTILAGVIRPKFTTATIEKLLEKNGETVKQLSDEIWDLGRISKKVFDDYITALKKAEEQKKATSKQTTPQET